jgi:AraC family transcriptional regulator of adaptative response / DNA-3-methyladenine glycosylase II
LFKKHVGASPTQIAQTARVQRAKRMIDNTDLPMTAIALAAKLWQLAPFQHGICRCLRAPANCAPADKPRADSLRGVKQ